MFPSSEDKRMRAEGIIPPNAPSLPIEPLTLDSVCAFIIARLRYDFISGEETIKAYIDITHPWTLSGFPEAMTHNNTALYGSHLEAALSAVFDNDQSNNFIESSCIKSPNAMVNIFFRKVITKSHYHGIYGISIRGDVVDHESLAA